MLDETVWQSLSEEEKLTTLSSYLTELCDIAAGTHALSKTREQGRLASIRKDLEQKVFSIIELENIT